MNTRRFDVIAIDDYAVVVANEEINVGDWCVYNDGGSKEIRKVIKKTKHHLYFSEDTFAKAEIMLRIVASLYKKMNDSIPVIELPDENEIDMAYANYCRDNPSQMVVYGGFELGYKADHSK